MLIELQVAWSKLFTGRGGFGGRSKLFTGSPQPLGLRSFPPTENSPPVTQLFQRCQLFFSQFFLLLLLLLLLLFLPFSLSLSLSVSLDFFPLFLPVIQFKLRRGFSSRQMLALWPEKRQQIAGDFPLISGCDLRRRWWGAWGRQRADGRAKTDFSDEKGGEEGMMMMMMMSAKCCRRWRCRR